MWHVDINYALQQTIYETYLACQYINDCVACVCRRLHILYMSVYSMPEYMSVYSMPEYMSVYSMLVYMSVDSMRV